MEEDEIVGGEIGAEDEGGSAKEDSCQDEHDTCLVGIADPGQEVSGEEAGADAEKGNDPDDGVGLAGACFAIRQELKAQQRSDEDNASSERVHQPQSDARHSRIEAEGLGKVIVSAPIVAGMQGGPAGNGMTEGAVGLGGECGAGCRRGTVQIAHGAQGHGLDALAISGGGRDGEGGIDGLKGELEVEGIKGDEGFECQDIDVSRG